MTIYQRTFFNFEETKVDKRTPPAELYRNGCVSCPLNEYDKKLEHPKMPPSGSGNPLIYCLGEAPGAEEDRLGVQFVGSSGALLKRYLPKKYHEAVRWNNTLNCRPPNNRDPTKDEIEFCRSRIVDDIEASRPDAIFGLGGIPLVWSGRSNTFAWRGRHFPIQVGSHRCWYFSFHHPSYLLHLSRDNDGRPSTYELAFKLDMERAVKKVLDGLPPPEIHTVEDAERDIVTFDGNHKDDLERVLIFLRDASEQPICGFDYETQGLRPYARDAAILSVAIALPGICVAFALDHPEAGWSPAGRAAIKNSLKGFLLSPVVKCVHSLHFEMEWSAFFFGPEVLRSNYENHWEDSLTQAYILDERKDGFALDFLTQLYFGINIKKITGALNKNNMRAEPLRRLLPYNGIDAKYHLLTYQVQKDLIEQEGLQAAYEEKLRQIPTCVLTQLAGLPVDYEENVRQQDDFKRKIRQLEDKIFALPEVLEYENIRGQKFNPGSDKDVKFLLNNIFHIGTNSTDKKVLEEIDIEFGRLEIAWRHYSKMASTYVERFNKENAYPDNLYHISLGTVFTDTGRLSGDFQNVPKRGEEVSTRRQIAGKGIFASFDYGQIEARLIACASQDRSYCKATWDGLDVHGYWAKRIAKRYPLVIGGKEYLDDPATMRKFRDAIKNKFVFPSFFSASLRSVSGYLNIPEEVLEPEVTQFWREYKGVKAWQQTLLDTFNRVGYTACLNGRRRRAPLGLGQVVNSMIQGSAADVVMDAMNRLSETGDPVLQPRLQIHDDLLFYFDSEEQLSDYVPIIVEHMLNVKFPWIIVPLTIEMSVGPNWCDMKPGDVFSSDKLLNWPERRKEFL